MKLIVTVGNAANQTEELVFELPEPITWLGVEIDDPRPMDEQPATRREPGRMTVLRIPFYQHGKTIHTMCRLNDPDNVEVYEG